MLIDLSYFITELNIPNTDKLEVQENILWYIQKYEIEILRDALGMDLYRAFMDALGQTVSKTPVTITSNANITREDLWIKADSTPGFSSGQNQYVDASLASWQYSVELPGSGTLRPGEKIEFIPTGGFRWINGYTIQPNEEYVIHFSPSQSFTGTSQNVWSSYLYVTNGLADPTKMDQRWVDLLNGKEYIGLDARRHKWQGFIAAIDDTTPKKSIIANYVYYYWMRNNATHTTGTTEVVANAENAINVSNNAKAMSAWNEMVDWLHEMIWFLDTANAYDYNYYPGWWLQNRYYLLKKYKKINLFNL